MLRDDIIQPSKSPSASPVVLVKNKGGTQRFCLDYRRLNKITKKDVYAHLRIDDALDRLHNARYFSSMNFKTSSLQIEVDKKHREKTGFMTPDNLFEFTVIPFGLSLVPATFERVIDTVLAGSKCQTCFVYMDGVIVFLSSFGEHLQCL